jgi:hypothetical protein
MNELCTISIINSLHAKFVMYEKNMHINFVPHFKFFPQCLAWKRFGPLNLCGGSYNAH